MTLPIRIVVVDDHPLLREGVIHILSQFPDFEVVGEGENSEEALRLAKDLMPDIILLDIVMPGGGIEACQKIALACPVIKIAMLTVSEQNDDVVKALEAGAHGYILKGVTGPELIDIINILYNDNSYVSPILAGRLLSESKKNNGQTKESKNLFAELTAREEQILQGISNGMSNKEIGTELGISEKTVKHYVTNVLQKLHVRNRVQAALLAQKQFS